jgi:hypothetical protein
MPGVLDETLVGTVAVRPDAPPALPERSTALGPTPPSVKSHTQTCTLTPVSAVAELLSTCTLMMLSWPTLASLIPSLLLSVSHTDGLFQKLVHWLIGLADVEAGGEELRSVVSRPFQANPQLTATPVNL